MSCLVEPPLSAPAPEHSHSPTQPSERVAQPRIHYLDNLRAIAMLLGVVLHAGLAYAEPAQSIWLATDTRSSRAMDMAIWFIHLFRMSLFYMLSGYFAKLVVQRKGVIGFLKNRATRLLLPFLLFAPPLTVAMIAVIGFALSYVQQPKGILLLIATAANSADPPQSQPISTMHLWFIYYLMYFSLLAVVLRRWEWRWIEQVWRKPVLVGTLAVIALSAAVLFAGVPLPAPESIVPTWWPFVFYGLFFASGWRLVGRESWLDQISRHLIPLVVVAAGLYVPYYWLMPVLNLDLLTNSIEVHISWRTVAAAVLTAVLSILWTAIAVVAAQKFLSRRSSLLRIISDSSYWIYLIHLPIVLFLQTLMIPADWPVWFKFSLVLFGTLLPSCATYLIFVRYTPLGWLLHGKRTFP